MQVSDAYRQWAEQYDTNKNKTRDLEAKALQQVLTDIPFEQVLEIGCGTGKNTLWLAQQARRVDAVDLSPEMLAIARQKVRAPNVHFQQANVLHPWHFATQAYDLVSFSLVLEHLEDLESIFRKASKVVRPGGHLYLGELHPYKQYSGSKARFESREGVQEVQCYTHHLSEYLRAGEGAGFKLKKLEEFFDNGDANSPPRILALLWERK